MSRSSEEASTVIPDTEYPPRGLTPPSVSPPYWTERWCEIQAQLQTRPRLLLALGFDGIISPLAPKPAIAVVPEQTRVLLQEIGCSPRVTLAFLSGRSLEDLRARIDLPEAYYAGNHGMEVCGPGLASSDGLAVSCRSDLVDALGFLARCTKGLPGIVIEDKKMAVTVHWRMADSPTRPMLKELMDLIVRSHPRLRLVAGVACWELRARASWNEGDALDQILHRTRLAPADGIYIGDRVDDFHAFAHLPGGLTFCVGEDIVETARYRIRDTADVAALLNRIRHHLVAARGARPEVHKWSAKW